MIFNISMKYNNKFQWFFYFHQKELSPHKSRLDNHTKQLIKHIFNLEMFRKSMESHLIGQFIRNIGICSNHALCNLHEGVYSMSLMNNKDIILIYGYDYLNQIHSNCPLSGCLSTKVRYIRHLMCWTSSKMLNVCLRRKHWPKSFTV